VSAEDSAPDAAPDPAPLVVTDQAAAQRYEVHRNGELAGFLDYVVKRGRLALVHTETLPAHAGSGVAGAVARFALEDARARGLRVIPICPFVRSYLERHPEYADLVVGSPPR
jgi:predicted GNAT family acetyltransferase